MLKRCSDCKELLPTEAFCADRSRSDGLSYKCRVCNRERNAKRYEEKRDVILEQGRERYIKNRDEVLARCRRYQEENSVAVSERRKRYKDRNKDQLRANSSEWAKSNRHLRNATLAKRRAAVRNAIPKWADLDEIKTLYELANTLSTETGIRYSVDHIVPIISDKVCGLHVANNMRVLELKENMAKGNRFWPEMPGELNA